AKSASQRLGADRAACQPSLRPLVSQCRLNHTESEGNQRAAGRIMRTAKVEALLNPTSVAILGARENPSGWTARIFANLQRFDFPGPVYPVNPNHDTIWGVPCFPGLPALPVAPDHLVVMRAAPS